MVIVSFDPSFEKILQKMKDESLKIKIKKQIAKILQNPETGKPMRFARKGTREVYIAPFRLSYLYVKEEDKVIILYLFHKDER